MNVREIALAAYQKDQAGRERQREELAERRRAEEAALDEATLAWVRDPKVSLLARWFPNETWVLVDRQFPQATAVVHPVDDPDLLLIITSGHPYISVPPGSARSGSARQWLAGATSMQTLAQLGELITTRARSAARTAIEEVAE